MMKLLFIGECGTGKTSLIYRCAVRLVLLCHTCYTDLIYIIVHEWRPNIVGGYIQHPNRTSGLCKDWH